jgi:hypothetical protein
LRIVGHNLPTVPILRDTDPGGLMEEFSLRVLVELPDWEMRVVGTATIIGSFLALPLSTSLPPP